MSLLEDLLEDGMYACGTARKDRKEFPDTLKGVRELQCSMCTKEREKGGGGVQEYKLCV